MGVRLTHSTDSRVKTLTRNVRAYDRELFCDRDSHGVIHVYRNAMRFLRYDFDGKNLSYAVNQPQIVLSLTDNWMISGKSREWGIEPLMRRLAEIDNWNDDSKYDDMCRDRAKRENWAKEAKRQEYRAVAADMRRDFAKAVSEINTSTINKIDRRRLKGA